MPEKRDYYDVLGINKGASDDEIKKSYRKMAKQYHPDLNPNDKTAEAKFKEANEAYEILSDKEKKARYDQFGFAGVDANYGASQGGGYGGGYGGFGGGVDLGDIFGDLFGFGGGRRGGNSNGPARGEDISTSVVLTLEEAVLGVKKTIKFTRKEACSDCKGSGAAKGTHAETCPICKGSGQVRRAQNTILGSFATVTACTSCNGKGKIIKNPCPTCRGVARVSRERSFEVNIPAGIDDGQGVNLSGQGCHGLRGGGPGDVVVGVRVKKHDFFTRRGLDLYCQIPLTYLQAALGDEIEIPQIDKTKQKLKIPEGTQSGASFSIRGGGVPRINSRAKGDLKVAVFVEVPKHLTPKQKELLKEFEKISVGKTYEKRKSFMDRFKNN